jgi:hypothetical protein
VKKTALSRQSKNVHGRILRLALSHGTQGRALKLAVIVGTILLLINQWEACIGYKPIDWAKAVLTYIVPYLVSVYTSVVKDHETMQRAGTFC